MARRALVTGGAGFIGSHIVEAYLAAGWEVTALDDLSRGKASQVPDGVPLIVADIRSDLARTTVATGGFDVLNHHAAQIDVRFSVEQPAADADINIAGFVNMLDGAGQGGVQRVVFASSGGVVYGDPDVIPTPESAAKRPVSPYGVSKLAGEHYLRALGGLHGFEGVALRYANVCGPRQDPKSEAGVVSIFVSRLLAGQPLAIFGDGKQTRDYVSVLDVARANVLASTAPLASGDDHDTRAFNIATGIERSVLELADIAGKVTGQTPELMMEPARPGEILRSALDPKKAADVLGWRPEMPFDDNLALLMEWFQTEGVMLLQVGGAVPRSSFELLQQAGGETKIVLAVTALFSIVSWFIIGLKWWQFRRIRRQADHFFTELERTTRLQEAYTILMKQPPSPYNRLFREGMNFYSELRPGALRDEAPAARASLTMTQLEALKMVLGKEVSAERELAAHLVPWLATIGAVSPLLGLLGTVLGIMDAFIGIAAKGSGNIAAVAPGVAEALITTVAGLATAIPAMMAYNFFVHRTRVFAGELEGFANELIGTMAREGLL